MFTNLNHLAIRPSCQSPSSNFDLLCSLQQQKHSHPSILIGVVGCPFNSTNWRPFSRDPHSPCIKARNTLALRLATHQMRQPLRAMPRLNVICFKMKNANVLMWGGMFTADLTCTALASVGALFDGPTANGSDCTACEANQGYSHAPKLAVHTSALRHAEAASFDGRLASAQVYSRLYVTLNKVLLSSAHIWSATHVPHAHTFAIIARLASHQTAPFSADLCMLLCVSSYNQMCVSGLWDLLSLLSTLSAFTKSNYTLFLGFSGSDPGRWYAAANAAACGRTENMPSAFVGVLFIAFLIVLHAALYWRSSSDHDKIMSLSLIYIWQFAKWLG